MKVFRPFGKEKLILFNRKMEPKARLMAYPDTPSPACAERPAVSGRENRKPYRLTNKKLSGNM
jgi:hypothetical protein